MSGGWCCVGGGGGCYRACTSHGPARQGYYWVLLAASMLRFSNQQASQWASHGLAAQLLRCSLLGSDTLPTRHSLPSAQRLDGQRGASRLNPYAEYAYDGIYLNPMEVLFVKVKGFTIDGDWTSPKMAATYDRWISQQVRFSSAPVLISPLYPLILHQHRVGALPECTQTCRHHAIRRSCSPSPRRCGRCTSLQAGVQGRDQADGAAADQLHTHAGPGGHREQQRLHPAQVGLPHGQGHRHGEAGGALLRLPLLPGPQQGPAPPG